MNHYRIYKLNRPKGTIIKGKDVVAPDDDTAIREAASDDDCPDCEIWKGKTKIGEVV